MLVLKDRLAFFPPPGEPFTLDDSDATRAASVDAAACTCRGPEKPHEHWRIVMPGLSRGGMVSFLREPGSPPRYHLVR